MNDTGVFRPHDLARRSLASIWHPCTRSQGPGVAPPLAIVRGKGAWLYDEHGRRYFDAISSWWVNLFGHADEQLAEAVKDQLDTLPHVMLAGCTHAPAVELAERLSERTGGSLGHCFFASDGASAVEIALKMSVHHWRNLGLPGKREFVRLKQGYHGETLGALAVTDVPAFRDAYDALLMRSHVVASPDARLARAGETAATTARRAAQELDVLLRSRHEHIAAVIVEPMVQCAGGMAMHDAQYLRELRILCDRYGVLLVADEIAVACGRTGKFFAFEHATRPGEAALWPDLLCLSKGISGGMLPLSLVMASDAVYDSFAGDRRPQPFLHSHSYTGNPLACRAALAVLDRFDDDDVLEVNRERSALMTTALAPLMSDMRIQHARRLGMLWAFDVHETVAGPRFAERFQLAGRRHQLLIRPIGRTVYLMPPYLLNDTICGWLAQQLSETLEETLAEDIDADRTPERSIA